MRQDVENTARSLEKLAASHEGSKASALLVLTAQLLRELDAMPPSIQPLHWTKSGDGMSWHSYSLGLAYEVTDDETTAHKKEQCQSDRDSRIRAVLDDGRDLVAGFAVPLGWKLVPEDPTAEMQRAGFETLGPDRDCPCDQYDCYRAMVEATPKPFAAVIPYDSPFSYERTSHLRDIKELHEALRPFATAAGSIPDDLPRERADDRICDIVPDLAITVREIRRAAGMVRPIRPSVVGNVNDQRTSG
jgi:hypothetical protein